MSSKVGLDVATGHFRVILVALPADRAALGRYLPVTRTITADDLPMAIRITQDRMQAEQTVERLRAVGAEVVLVEQWDEHGLFCHTHSGRIATQHCHVCEQPVCHSCTHTAGGVPTCRTHLRARESRAGWRRTRQLAVVLVFSVFLYKVAEYLVEDYSSVTAASVVEVGVFQLVGEEHRYADLIRGINGLPTKGAYEGPTLTDMKRWYDEERARYSGIQGEYLRLRVHGPWVEVVKPPDLFGDDEGPIRLAWRALSYTRYWRDLARLREVNPNDYPVQLFISYSPGGDDTASHSRGSDTQRLAIAHVDANERNPTYAVVTIAHELAHALGAEDLYTEQSTASFPEGYVEPFREPLFPQRYAELMAVDVPTSRYGEREATSLDEVRVGYHSAALMGWIEPSRADYFYSPQGISPEDVLDQPLAPEDEVEDEVEVDLSP